jgi:hypothetical protein
MYDHTQKRKKYILFYFVHSLLLSNELMLMKILRAL